MVENVVTVLTFVQFAQNVNNLTQLLLFCGKVLKKSLDKSYTFCIYSE
jgi:hypothetical protein